MIIFYEIFRLVQPDGYSSGGICIVCQESTLAIIKPEVK